MRDQYLVRAHYAVGKLVSEMSQGLKVRQAACATAAQPVWEQRQQQEQRCGAPACPLTCPCGRCWRRPQGKPLVDGTLEAVRHVQRGLELASSNPSRYLFLVYNGSVHNWHVSRPLQRAGLRHHLLPSMEQVMQALEKVPGHEEWKVRNLMALAMCQAEAQPAAGGKGGGGADEATKTLQRAYDLAAANQLAGVQKEVAALQASCGVHFSNTCSQLCGVRCSCSAQGTLLTTTATAPGALGVPRRRRVQGRAGRRQGRRRQGQGRARQAARPGSQGRAGRRRAARAAGRGGRPANGAGGAECQAGGQGGGRADAQGRSRQGACAKFCVHPSSHAFEASVASRAPN